MSRTVENRVVEMQFKNQQFETAVAKSIHSINELNKSINLLEGTKALKSLDKSVNSLDFSGVNTGMQSLTDRFSTLGIIGASAINTITSAITSNLISAVTTAGRAVTGLFNDIKRRGTERAMAIQQARFSFQGLISTSEEGKEFTEEQTAKRIDDIMAAVNRSVADTPYSLARAASAASVLAAAYGTSNDAIEKMETTLKTISGLAAQTGADYGSVADVMQNVAASGVLMGEDLRRMTQWGLGASTYLKDYINADTDLRKKMNAILSTKKETRKSTQLITEADIKDLASKRAISADMINEVFGVFFDNAQKANDTLKGVTENIGAALGRLGALFVEPIIQNKGPWVLFLQTVKSKISDIANELKAFGVDTNFVSTVTTLIENGNELLKALDVSDFSIFERLGTVTQTISRALSTEHVGEAGTNLSTVFTEAMDRWREANPQKTYEDFIKDVTHMNGITMDMLRNADLGEYVQGMTAGEILNEVYKRMRQQSEDTARAQDAILENSKTVYANIRSVEEVWEYDYFGNLVEAFNNFKDAFGEIGSVIFETIGESIPELKEFFNILTGKELGQFTLRKVINDIVEGIRIASEKFKSFVTENESFRSFLSGIGSAFVLVWRALKAAKQIVVNAFNSFKPLFDSFLSLSGLFGDFLGDLVQADDETDIFGNTVTIVSGIIDKFAQILITVKDGIKDFILSISGKDNMGEVFDTIKNKISTFTTESQPFVDKVGGIFDTVKEKIETFFGYFSGLGEKINKIPTIISLIKRLFTGNKSSTDSENITDNGIFEEVDEMAEDYEHAPEKIDAVADSMDNISNSINKLIGKIATFLISSADISDEDIDKALNRLKLIADIILELATAFGIVRGSTALKNATGLEGLKKILDDPKAFQNNPITQGFKSVSGAITSLTEVLKKSINPTEMIKEWQKAKRMEALSEIIKSIAAFILLFAVSIAILVYSLVKLATIKTDALIKGGIALGIIFIALAGIIVAVMLIASKIGNDTRARTTFEFGKIKGNKTDSPVAKIITSMAAFIGVFAAAVYTLTRSLVALSKIPEDALSRAQGSLFLIGGLLIGILGVVAFIVYKFVDKFGKTDIAESSGMFGKTKLQKIIDSVSGLLLSITGAVKVMTQTIQKLSEINEPALNRGVSALRTIAIIVGILMAEVMIFMYLMTDSQVFTADSGASIKAIASIAAMMIILGAVIYAIASAVSKLAEAPINGLEKATGVLTTIAFVLGGLGLVCAALAYFFQTDMKNLILAAVTIAILAGALSITCVAIGEMVSALGQSGFKSEEIESILQTMMIFLGGMVIIAAIIGGIAASTGVILIGIAVVAILVAAIGAAAVGIGAGVALVGAGVLMFARAVDILMETFKKLNKAEVTKIMKNLKTFVEMLPEVIFAGFRSFFRQISRNKDTIVDGIISLLTMIFEAVFAWIPAAFKTWLGTLGELLDTLLVWLGENSEKIVTLIETIWGLIRDLLGGPDGKSGILADLLGLLFGTLEVLFMGGNGYDGLIQYTINMMLYWCQVVDENAHKLADSFFNAVIAVINAMADAVNNHHEELSTAIDNLIDSVINALDEEFGVDGDGANKSTTDIISKFVKSMFLPSMWLVTPSAKQVLTDFKDAMVDSLDDLFKKALFYGTNPIVHWLIAGIKRKLQPLAESGNLVAGTIYQAITNNLEVNSPSKKTTWVGEEVVNGLIVGMEAQQSSLKKASGKTGSVILSPLNKIKQKMKLFFNGMLDELNIESFTITPTMDLTQIQEGFGDIEGMMNGTSSFDISALSGNMTDSLGASETANGFDNINMPDATDLEGINTETVVNFTQNNYSPEALSRIDIYRDTKNALNNPSLINIFNR